MNGIISIYLFETDLSKGPPPRHQREVGDLGVVLCVCLSVPHQYKSFTTSLMLTKFYV